MNQQRSVLFLHMPKCAGSSMKSVFQSIYGANFKEDYDSFFKIPRPERYKAIATATTISKRENSGIIGGMTYGHFFPIKYLANLSSNQRKNIILATFLRDPLDRLASHYAFWTRMNQSQHYLWKKMRQENWSFTRFALSLEMKDFYSQHFFQVPIKSFDFIGICENIDRDWMRLCELLKIKSQELPHINKSSSKSILSKIPEELKSEIRDFHAEDYFIYETALTKSLDNI